MSRVEGYGRVDRDRTVHFVFDGVAHTGHPGDTLASALLANGVHRVGSSVRLGRPRGIGAAWSEDPTGLVQIEEPFPEPMLLASTVELTEGLVARGVNGQGRLAQLPDTARYDRKYTHCDTLVVGAGPAGLLAARTAASTGRSVVLLDDRPAAGGSLTGTETINGRPALEFVAGVVAELAEYAEVVHLQRTTAFGHYDDGFVLALQRRADHLAPGQPVSGHLAPGQPGSGQLGSGQLGSGQLGSGQLGSGQLGSGQLGSGHRSRQRVHRIRAGEVVVAAGAHERPIVFADNDRPGVMLAGAARDFLHRYGVLAGHQVVVFTSDDAAYAAAVDLADAGAEVTVLDARTNPPAHWSTRCARRGIVVHPGTVVTGTLGEDRVRAVQATHPDGARRSLAADLLLVCGGWNPTVHLFSHVRGALAYDPELGAFVPAETLPGVRVIGAAAGTLDLSGCLRAGASGPTSQSVGSLRGRPDNRDNREVDPSSAKSTGDGEVPVAGAEPERTATLVLWRTEGDPQRQFVDIQRDATVADIARSVGAGMRSVEHIKRYTTIGTAHDQGKTSGVIAAGITAELLGRPVGELGTTTFRPPYTPVAFAALAGRQRGRLFDPERTTALHSWQVAAGAVFEDVGQWKRARYYPRPDEDMAAAVLRECAAVRGGVGILDGSTLGKIDVQGPDAAELLDRIYPNLMSNLKVGRVRYGVMCGTDGMVIDDGTVLRLAADRFMVTTTTGGAAPILDWLEEWRQTEWPELRVHLASVTEQWAVFPVVGPRSREVIGSVFGDLDVSNEAFPFMSWQDTTLDGPKVRLARISFSGELAYEVNVNAWYARSLWLRLLEAGQRFGITPYGTETMHVLRAEKGYPIIGQDTDGTVTPQDLGMSWVVSKKKVDFVGKRSFERAENHNPLRKQLVSLLPTDAATTLPEGSQIVEYCPDGALPAPPVPMLGHVTSSYHSAELGRPFALALVKGGRGRIGDVVHVPVDGVLVPAEIAGSVLVDPQGERRDG